MKISDIPTVPKETDSKEAFDAATAFVDGRDIRGFGTDSMFLGMIAGLMMARAAHMFPNPREHLTESTKLFIKALCCTAVEEFNRFGKDMESDKQ